MWILLTEEGKFSNRVAIVDPPRRGLSESALAALANLSGKDKRAGAGLDALLYLSCYPASLLRDLKGLVEKGWKVEKVIPFDFFPKTKHLETLVLLKP